MNEIEKERREGRNGWTGDELEPLEVEGGAGASTVQDVAPGPQRVQKAVASRWRGAGVMLVTLDAKSADRGHGTSAYEQWLAAAEGRQRACSDAGTGEVPRCTTGVTASRVEELSIMKMGAPHCQKGASDSPGRSTRIWLRSSRGDGSQGRGGAGKALSSEAHALTEEQGRGKAGLSQGAQQCGWTLETLAGPRADGGAQGGCWWSSAPWAKLTWRY